MAYNFSEIEKRWQAEWESSGIYNTKGKGKKWYSLFEFPYPSGDGLHVGHLRPYIGMDVISRKRRMEGYDVLFPIGWDAFGLPTENYAIKNSISPEVATKKNTDNFRRQFKSFGPSLDWSREIDTTDPNYYKWTQWMFLKFFEQGMAYKAKTYINWCPKDKIGLANEEAAGGVCDRCGGPVEKREKEQWMISITKYADKLLAGLKDVHYIPQAKIQQENWIGRSEGAEINFKMMPEGDPNGFDTIFDNFDSPESGGGAKRISTFQKIFTTRPDTIFGATYLVFAPEHTFIEQIDKSWIKNWSEVEKYIASVKNRSEEERLAEGKEKTGVELKGIKALNPATKEEIPVFIADYVLPNYGTGAIMAVPAHDERDFAFAKKYKLPIRPVVSRPLSKINGSGALLFTKRGDLLLQKRDQNAPTRAGMIAPFGGRLDAEDKNVLANIERELKEEIELDVNKTQFEYIGDFESHNFPGKFLAVFSIKDVEKAQLVQHEGAGIAELSVADALSEDLVTDFTKDILRGIQKPYEEGGTLLNSGKFTGMKTDEARIAMTKAFGVSKVQYKLRDWVFSRQRYWGEPIPLVYCEQDGWVPVPEKELPVTLPKVEKYQPTDTGESPLANMTEWVSTKCPNCKGPAKRETDTMPNWAGSSWYFLRYTDSDNKKEFASKKALKYFMPVDWYNGGMEHTVLHLLYSRFWNMFLYDCGLVPTSEPYQKRTSHGLILAEGGVKMSKSKGNVISPDDIISEYGADALRTYEMFMGPFEQAIAWDKRGILGTVRFLEKVWNIATHTVDADSSAGASERLSSADNRMAGKTTDKELLALLHKTIKKVSADIEAMAFNTAISSLMVFINKCDEYRSIDSKTVWAPFLQLLAPFAPHIAEELWVKIGNKQSIHTSGWPVADEQLLVEDTFELIIQVNGKMRDKVSAPIDLAQADAENLALGRDEVKKWVSGTPKKVIFVKNRLINFIV